MGGKKKKSGGKGPSQAEVAVEPPSEAAETASSQNADAEAKSEAAINISTACPAVAEGNAGAEGDAEKAQDEGTQVRDYLMLCCVGGAMRQNSVAWSQF